jgi:hypothetical protein
MSDSSNRNGDRPKVVVGSGWWCDNRRASWTIGAPPTRSPAFFDLWLRQVHRCLRPHRVVVIDSASPIKPDARSDASLVWIELDRNYGHANDLRTGRINTKYSGFTRSILTYPAITRSISAKTICGSSSQPKIFSPEEIMARRLAPFGLLRIPFGRSRPIDFGLTHFYAQHLTEHDLAKALQLLQTRSGPMLLADRGYDANWIRALASQQGCCASNS